VLNCKSFLVTEAERKHVRRHTETWSDRQQYEFYLSGLQKLEQRAKKCIELRGEYVE